MPLVSRSQLSFESGGKQIRMDCYLPVATTHDLPAVIGLHGSGGNAEGMSDSASLLAGQGFAVYIPHYFNRTGTASAVDKATIVRHFFAWAKTVWDAVSFVVGQSEVNREHIGLLGFSLGAYLALSVAAIDTRIQAVVEYFGGFPKELKLFMRRLCPVLILHGDADATVPVEEAYYLQKILENKQIPYEMKIYPGADHSFNDDVLQDSRARTLAFLRKHLIDQQS